MLGRVCIIETSLPLGNRDIPRLLSFDTFVEKE
jgi:hypothetical protein